MSVNHNADSKSPQIKMYTTDWCPDCWRAKQVLQSANVDYLEINITQDADAVTIVQELNNGHQSVPTILFPDGSVLTEPSTVELMGKLKELG